MNIAHLKLIFHSSLLISPLIVEDFISLSPFYSDLKPDPKAKGITEDCHIYCAGALFEARTSPGQLLLCILIYQHSSFFVICMLPVRSF